MKQLINLLHLKFFCDAVVCNSISEAAKKNFVTQSTVSQAIAKLERILGVSVLVHARQKFQITEEGKILFEQSRHLFKAVQDIHEKIHQDNDVLTGSLNFVCTNSLGMSFIASSFKMMQANYPQVEMHMQLGNLNFIRNTLRQNEAELAIVVFDESFKHFAKIPLYKGRFHLYQNEEAPHHQIEKGILVDSLDGMFVNDLLDYFKDQGQPLKIQSALAGWEVVARFTEKNIGLGLFPDYIIANGRYSNIQTSPIEIPAFEYEICAIHNKGKNCREQPTPSWTNFQWNETMIASIGKSGDASRISPVPKQATPFDEIHNLAARIIQTAEQIGLRELLLNGYNKSFISQKLPIYSFAETQSYLLNKKQELVQLSHTLGETLNKWGKELEPISPFDKERFMKIVAYLADKQIPVKDLKYVNLVVDALKIIIQPIIAKRKVPNPSENLRPSSFYGTKVAIKLHPAEDGFETENLSKDQEALGQGIRSYLKDKKQIHFLPKQRTSLIFL